MSIVRQNLTQGRPNRVRLGNASQMSTTRGGLITRAARLNKATRYTTTQSKKTDADNRQLTLA